jgi:hypothetical protein
MPAQRQATDNRLAGFIAEFETKLNRWNLPLVAGGGLAKAQADEAPGKAVICFVPSFCGSQPNEVTVPKGKLEVGFTPNRTMKWSQRNQTAIREK